MSSELEPAGSTTATGTASDFDADEARIVVHENVDGTFKVDLVIGTVVEDTRTASNASEKRKAVKELVAIARDRGLNVEVDDEHKPRRGSATTRARVETL